MEWEGGKNKESGVRYPGSVVENLNLVKNHEANPWHP